MPDFFLDLRYRWVVCKIVTYMWWWCLRWRWILWMKEHFLSKGCNEKKIKIKRQKQDMGSWKSRYLYAVLSLVAQSCLTLCDPTDCSPPGFSVHGNSPDKNTRVGFHALLQGIFPIQEPNPSLPHCRQILYCLSHQENPRIPKY